MLIINKQQLNNHLEATKVSVLFTKSNAEKGVLGNICISEILFCFSAEKFGSRVLVPIHIFW